MVNLQHDEVFHSFFVLKKAKQKQTAGATLYNIITNMNPTFHI